MSSYVSWIEEDSNPIFYLRLELARDQAWLSIQRASRLFDMYLLVPYLCFRLVALIDLFFTSPIHILTLPSGLRYCVSLPAIAPVLFGIFLL